MVLSMLNTNIIKISSIDCTFHFMSIQTTNRTSIVVIIFNIINYEALPYRNVEFDIEYCLDL